MELEAKIADLGFSAKTYFLCNFLFKYSHSEKSYRGLKFYVCGLRGETGFLWISITKNNSLLHRNRSEANVSEFVLLELLAQRRWGRKPKQNKQFLFVESMWNVLSLRHNLDPWFSSSLIPYSSCFFQLFLSCCNLSPELRAGWQWLAASAT